MRTRLALLVVLIVVVAALLYRQSMRLRAQEHPSDSAGSAGSAAAANTASPAPPPNHPGSPTTAPPSHATRLSKAERQAVADRIAAVRAERAEQAPPRPPSLPADPDAGDALAQISPQLEAAFKEAIPFLAECYKTGQMTDRHPAVQMSVISDPEVGTIIDPDQLHDAQGKPLEPGLESCLRTTLESLELPPLGATVQLNLKYSFRFDDE